MLYLSLVSLGYLFVVMPFNTKSQNRIEIFNEGTVYIINVMFTFYLNPEVAAFVGEYVGLLIIFSSMFNMIVNLSIVIHGAISDSIDDYRAWKIERKSGAHTKNKLHNFKVITKHLPGRFKEVESTLQELDAVDYCSKWIVERKWLKANNVDFSDYPEEIKFQDYCKRFTFKQRAKVIEIIAG